MPLSMDQRIAEYLPLCQTLAAQLEGSNEAEVDDLVQEGLIRVWQKLDVGEEPSPSDIKERMVDWVRTLGRQTGRYMADASAPDEYLITE